jgi:hypothetical protein
MKTPKASIGPEVFALSALGLTELYPWQLEILAACGRGMPTALLAPNGSGKSSTVLTALILWFLAEFPRGRAVITSGSWAQLRSQLFDNLKRFQGYPIFRGFEFQESAIKTPLGGWAMGFSVEDSFRMEGHHSRDGSPVLVVIDEGKALGQEIYEALDKCTPSFKIVVSSAGPATGRLYKIFTSQSAFWFRRKITYRDCPHLSETQRLIDLELYPAGEQSTFYRNRWLSEFAADAGESLISLDSIRACIANPPPFQSGIVTAGCDFAAGGDSCVLGISTGNRLEIVDSWKHSNPSHSVGKFINLFRARNLQGYQISGDAGGLGVGFVYNLQEAGFFIQPVHNGSPAKNPEQYANLAAEMWDGFNVLIQNRRVILPNDERLIAELSNRRKEYDGKGRIKLESKADMKARGASSPDLADGIILASMTGWGSYPSSQSPALAALSSQMMARSIRVLEQNQGFSFGLPHLDFTGW